MGIFPIDAVGVSPYRPDMDEKQQFLTEVAAFCERVGMAETTFGFRALNDGKTIPRLRAGGRCWPETIAKARTFMRDYRTRAEQDVA